MKKGLFQIFMFTLFIAAFVISACGAPTSVPPQSTADYWIVSGSNAYRVLGNGSDGLLIDKWADANNTTIYVEKLGGPEARSLKDKALSTGEGPDAFVFDDGLYAEGLKNSLSIAQAHTGLWIEDKVATAIGLPRGTNVISMVQYVDLLNNGQLSVVAGNATSSTASSEHFYSVLTWCSGQNTANLTMEMVNDAKIQECGKSVYDHIKTVASSSDSINLVYDGITKSQDNIYNAVIAFDSTFLGKDGYNETMIQKSGTYMRFFYFKEATPVSVVTYGSKDLSGDVAKNDLIKSLGTYLTSDEVQKAFNFAGLGTGASSVATPDESVFKSEWGVTMYPDQIVNVTNPPVPTVAFDALTIYAQYYKRAKEVNFCIDTSGSTETADDYNTPRLQSIDKALVTASDPKWQSDNSVIVGNGDRITYRFFATIVTPIITETIGQNTKPAGDYINTLIGPATGNYDFRGNERIVNQVVPGGYEFGSTAMFDCAEAVRVDIESRYNPNIDYYIVILTDGDLTEGINFDQFKDNWTAAKHKNISLIGIQFGNEGNDVSQEVVSQINGKHYDGNNAEDLIKAFKDIFNN